MTFAGGQTFPGAVTGATSNEGLAVSGSTLGLITSCAGGQLLKFDGAHWNCGTAVTSVGSGTGLVGGPITTTGTLGIDTSVVPQLGVVNTFTTSQFVDGFVASEPVGNSFAQVGGMRFDLLPGEVASERLYLFLLRLEVEVHTHNYIGG